MPCSRSIRSWPSIAIGLLLACGLLMAPDHVTTAVRLTVRDVALPGLATIHVIEQHLQWLSTADREFLPNQEVGLPDSALLAELESLRLANRRLTLRLAELATPTSSEPSAEGCQYVSDQGQPLFVPELIEARVIAGDVAEREYQRLINQGTADGLLASDLVLPTNEGQVLIDEGEDFVILQDQPALAGRCIVGRIEQVGKHTSTILPVTHPRFRGHAQLIRETPHGPRSAAEGLLAGTGNDKCRLTLVAATEVVAVGDDVYTSARGETIAVPMYYGKVVSAELKPGEPYWEIVVSPAASVKDCREVQVLRTRINPLRLTSLSSEGSAR